MSIWWEWQLNTINIALKQIDLGKSQIDNTLEELCETIEDPQVKRKLWSLLENEINSVLVLVIWHDILLIIITKIKRSKHGCFKTNLKYFHFRVNYFSRWKECKCKKKEAF